MNRQQEQAIKSTVGPYLDNIWLGIRKGQLTSRVEAVSELRALAATKIEELEQAQHQARFDNASRQIDDNLKLPVLPSVTEMVTYLVLETKEGKRLWELVGQLPFTVAEATRVQQSAAEELDKRAKELVANGQSPDYETGIIEAASLMPEVYLQHCAEVRKRRVSA